MAMTRALTRLRRRFARDEGGAVLVEFALVFPLMLLFLAIIIDIGVLLWSYQQAVAGVRDAGRYVARSAPVEICRNGGSADGFSSDLEALYGDQLMAIVETSGRAVGAPRIFTNRVTVDSVAARIDCLSGPYRTDPAPVSTVTAALTIDIPLGPIFGFFGDALPTSVSTAVADQARVYGQ
jgi:Flp pilus assembly protein TadG